jgi:protein phosphatase
MRRQTDDDPRKTRPLSDEADQDDQDSGATVQLTESLILEHYSERLRQAIEQASQAIVDYGDKHREAKGLGSTVTAALVIGEQAFIANVGDSRTYLLRNGRLGRVTTDHSLVERLVEAGQIDRAEVYDHPNRNLVYRSLGAGRSEVDVDIFTEKLQDGDVLMLCSDGLWEMVKDAQMESIITEVKDLVETCDLLIERANENGGEDNITVVLLRCVEG